MSKTHVITLEDGITKIRFLKKPTFAQVKSITDEISDHYPCERRLWDLSGVNFDFSTAEIRMTSEYSKTKFTEPGRLAIVAPDHLAYGEMRQFGVYREEEKTVTAIFRSEQEAVEWLNS